MKITQIKEPSVLVFFLKKYGGTRGLRGLGYFKNNKRIGSFQERTFGLKKHFFWVNFFQNQGSMSKPVF
jgi:hypothetical protein